MRTIPTDLGQRISLLLTYLRKQRVLLVLDNLETLLEEGEVHGHLHAGYESYATLLRRVAETEHQSCLLLTSREKPADFRSLEGKRSLTRSLRLSGLDRAACEQLFAEKGVIGTRDEQVYVIGWSPDGHLLASSDFEGRIQMWEIQLPSSATCVQVIAGHTTWIMISGGSDGVLRWWNVQSQTCVKAQAAHQGMVRSLSVSPDGWKLASSGDDGTVRIWNLESGALLRALRRDRPYERMNITGIKGVTEAQKATLRTLGALEKAV